MDRDHRIKGGSACILCGSVGSKKRTPEPLAPEPICESATGCLQRACARELAEDRKRGAPQCMSTTGTRSILFCIMGENHKGDHMNGTRRWKTKESSLLGKTFFAARRALREKIGE